MKSLVLCLHVSLFLIGWRSGLAQVGRSSFEKPDVYEFAETVEYKPRYQHDPKKKRRILNPDFYCSRCAKEGRIAARTRDDLKEKLEIVKTYPMEFQGRTSDRRGLYRLMDHPADYVLNWCADEVRSKNLIYIEDQMFRVVADLAGFSTKKVAYPRREEELIELADIFPRISKKTVQLNSHHHAHLYLIRSHRILRDMSGLIRHDPKAREMAFLGPFFGMKEKFEVYLFRKQRDCGKFVEKFLGHPPSLDGICWHTLSDDSMCAVSHVQLAKRDVDINNLFTHRLSYCMLIGWRGYQYDLPAWFTMGLAHLFERRERTDFNTFLLGEGRRPNLRIPSKWKPYVKKRIAKGNIPPLVQVCKETDVGKIPIGDRMIVWSQVSYLVSLGNEKASRFIQTLKSKKKGENLYNLQVRAFRRAYGLSIPVFEEQWKAWVKATYPSV